MTIPRKYYATRQMDDGLFVFLVKEGGRDENEEVWKMIDDAKTMYTGGPVTEIEDRVEVLGEKRRIWAGLELRVEEQGVVCKTYNKNEESIVREGRQKLPRYTPGCSYQEDRMRVGLMQGNAVRIRKQCTLDEDFTDSLMLDYWECMLIGTKWESIMEALKKLAPMIDGGEERWTNAKETIRVTLRRKMRQLR